MLGFGPVGWARQLCSLMKQGRACSSPSYLTQRPIWQAIARTVSHTYPQASSSLPHFPASVVCESTSRLLRREGKGRTHLHTHKGQVHQAALTLRPSSTSGPCSFFCFCSLWAQYTDALLRLHCTTHIAW